MGSQLSFRNLVVRLAESMSTCAQISVLICRILRHLAMLLAVWTDIRHVEKRQDVFAAVKSMFLFHFYFYEKGNNGSEREAGHY